jgi:hypothetical protein
MNLISHLLSCFRGQEVKHSGFRLAALWMYLVLMLLAPMSSAHAQVEFLSSSPTTLGGTANSSGVLTVKINYSVHSAYHWDSVTRVELREGTTILAFVTYQVKRGGPDGEPYDEIRTGALIADLGPGTHNIYLRAKTHDVGFPPGDSPTYTVTVLPNGTPPSVSIASPTSGSDLQLFWCHCFQCECSRVWQCQQRNGNYYQA